MAQAEGLPAELLLLDREELTVPEPELLLQLEALPEAELLPEAQPEAEAEAEADLLPEEERLAEGEGDWVREAAED